MKRKLNELEVIYKRRRKLSELAETAKKTDNALKQIIKKGLSELCEKMNTVSSEVLKA